jgi:hypothetical protein
MTMTEHNPTIPVSVPGEVLDAYRKADPEFCQFLEETGRINQYLHTKTTEA